MTDLNEFDKNRSHDELVMLRQMDRERISELKKGASARDLFAAQAPAAPDWFEPDFPPKPALFNVWDEINTEELRKQWEGYMDWLDAEDVDPIIVEMYDKVDESRKVIEKWKKEKEIERFFQWRWFYADQMMERRDSYVEEGQQAAQGK